MPAKFSPENRLREGLQELGCAERAFAEISGVVGRSRFSEALAGTNDLEHHDSERLLEILAELRELQVAADKANSVHVPINFANVRAISDALVIRRVRKIVLEDDDHSLDMAAESAAKRVAQQ